MKVPTDEDFTLCKDIVPHWDGTISGWREFHVMPEFDIKGHDWRFCKCNPHVETVYNGRSQIVGSIYVHTPYAFVKKERVRVRKSVNPRSPLAAEIQRLGLDKNA